MAFPTSPTDGDRYTTALGITYEYDITEDKWFVVATVLGGIASLEEDPSPQLGGDLDLNGNDIINVSNNYIHLYDEKTAGTHGGTFTQDAWQTRDLNVEAADQPSACQLNGGAAGPNQFELLAGTYIILAYAPGYQVKTHVAKLYNITDASDELIGTSEYSGSAGSYTQSQSFIAGVFTIASTKVFEIQHKCKITGSIGFGVNEDIGVVARYTNVQLWKVA